MFRSTLKGAHNALHKIVNSQSMSRRLKSRPFLERLETRTTPAFVTGLPVTESNVLLGSPQSLVKGDFNNDGKLDIMTSVYDSENAVRTIQLYKGNGDGTFQTPTSIPFANGQAPYDIAVADLNNDGKLDIVTSDQTLAKIYVRLGNGNGTFQAVVQYVGAANAGRLVLGDVDGNGSPDILESGGSDNKIRVLVNRGDGSFDQKTPLSTPAGGAEMTVGHFYGHSGKVDLAVYFGGQAKQILLFEGNGDGTFLSGQVLESSIEDLGALTTADVNKDGKDDVLAGFAGFVQVFVGEGDGTFKPPVTYNTHLPVIGTTPVQSGQIVAADLRNNGSLDLIVANGDVSVLLGNNDGTFQPSTPYVIGTGRVAVADFDADGKLDVIGQSAYFLERLKGNGNGTLQGAIAYVAADAIALHSIASADLNHDGIVDLVTGTHGTNVDVWIGNGDATYQPSVTYFAGTAPGSVRLTDLNNDGNFDIVAVVASEFTSTPNIAVLMGNAAGAFNPVQYIAGSTLINRVIAVDLNADGKIDLAGVTPGDLPAQTKNTLKIFLGKGDGTFLAPVSYDTDPIPNSIASADFNNDHKPDLLITTNGGGSGGTVEVFLNKGDGTFFVSPSARFFADSPLNAVAYDLFQTGNNDIVFISATTNKVIYYPGNGNGTFGMEHELLVPSNYPVAVVPGDFDGDDIPDLAVGMDLSGDIVLYTGDGAGGFSDASLFHNVSGRALPQMVAADLNNDGTLDLAIADTVNKVLTGLKDNNSITVLRNRSSATYFMLTALSSPAPGQPCQFVVTAINAAGETISNYSGTVHFTSSDPLGVLPSNLTLTNGVGAVSMTFNTLGGQYLRATDTHNSKITGTSANLSVGEPPTVHGPAARFEIPFPTQFLAGATFPLTVTVYDDSGLPVTDYAGTIHFSSSDPQAVLPSDYTFLASDKGSKTFPGVSLRTAGNWSLTVTDVANPALTSSRTDITVYPYNAATFVISKVSGNTTAGAPSSFAVTAFDAYGNVATTFTRTLHFSSTDPKAVLPADYKFQASDQGSKVFDGIVFKTAGSLTLTVSDIVPPSLSGSLANISVASANAAGFIVSNVPAQASAGVAANVTLSALDAFGNVATGYVGAVQFVSTDPQALLPGNYSFVAGDHGVKTIAVTFKTAGPQTLTIRDLAVPAMSVSTGAINVTPGALAKLVFLQQPTTGASGSVMKPAVTVQLFDAFGNLKSGGADQVSLASSLSSLALGGTTTVNAVNGVATFSNLVVTGGALGATLQASAVGVSAVSSAKFNMVVLSNILPVIVAPQIYGPRPNSSTREAFVKGVYRTLLGRDGDADGMSFWLGNLNGGAARSSIITAFWNSPENRGREVDTYYRAYLGRPAEAGGRSYWVSQLQGGADETAIVLSFLLSAEALNAPNAVFVQRLYEGALGRSASASDLAYWVGQLTQAQTRQQIANAFVFSAEAAGVAVDSFYQAYFQRMSDLAGRDYWVGQISNRRTSYASLAKSLLQSDEFFQNAAANVP